LTFYEYGNGSVFEVAAAANGVTYNAKAIATPITSSSSGSSSGSSSSSSNHAQALLDVPSMTLLRVAPVMIISGILFAWNLF